jgi:peptide/nickel transport system substrate-binding protein
MVSLLAGLRAGEAIRVSVNEWSTLNPLLINLDPDAEMVDLVFDRLVTLDAKGNFIPELLESWTILDGGRQVLLKLRPGLTWQDGCPIEAEDLVFTWRTLRMPQVRAVADTVGGVASLDSLVAEGPLTARIRLKRPRGTLLSDLYNFIPVPRHRYQVGARPAEAAVNFSPVGSGPYRVVGRATQRRVVLERWEGYHGPHPGLSGSFELLSPLEEAVNLQAFQRERLHFSAVDPLHYYLARRGAQGAGVVKPMAAPQAAFSAYFLNCDPKRSLLGDPALRDVIYELLPWRHLARARKYFPSRLATGFWTPESWAYDPEQRPFPQPDLAILMLEVAGWKLGPDGLRRNAQGRPLSLVAYERPTTSKPSEGTLLVLHAAKVGIQVELRSLPFQAVMEKAARHEGDLWAFGWTMSLDPDVDSSLFTREGYQTGANVSSYLNPEVDRLFDQGRHTLDPEARKLIYHQISELIFRDKPVIPIVYNQTRVLAHQRLQGVAFNLLGQNYGFWPGRRGWTLSP